MFAHLLFSISALILVISFVITYFSYKNTVSYVRNKMYNIMIYLSISLPIIEVLEGVTYVLNSSILFGLLWKIHIIIIILFVAFLFYYFVSCSENQINSIEDVFWNKNRIMSMRVIFSFIFVVMIVLSIILIKPHKIGLTSYYFYTNDSLKFLLYLYVVFLLYLGYIVYKKTKNDNFEGSDYVVMIGILLLFSATLYLEYRYPEVSLFSSLYALVLILIYHFKENQSLIVIDELKKNQTYLSYNNSILINSMQELVFDLQYPLGTYSELTNVLANHSVLNDEQLFKNVNDLNYISTVLINTMRYRDANRFTAYRIDELIMDVEKIIEPAVTKKSLRFICNIDQNLPSYLFGERVVLQRILLNLLINSVDSTTVGRITLDIAGKQQRNVEVLNITIYDTGDGIKKEDFDKVFRDDINIYNRRQYNMASIKRYVESLNGTISFDSQYQVGTNVYLSIPQNISNETPISRNPMLSNNISVVDCNKKRVLLLDDENYSTVKITNILNKYNLNVTSSKSGLEIINIVKSEEQFDLIIINDNIKDIDYCELASILDGLKRQVRVPPVIALVLNFDRNIPNNLFNDYILKPLDLKKLDEIIKQTLTK